MPQTRIHSIQIGAPRTVGVPGSDDPMERVFTSAIWKEPVAGRLWASAAGLAGDSVANRKVHGGPDQAVLAYGFAHYPRWREEWERDDVMPGAFGENLTLTELTEDVVCVGDVFRFGDVLLEVSKPREPCSTLARRHKRPELMDIVYRTGRSGWYLRVKRDGWLEAGQPGELVDRPFPQWPVRRAQDVMRARRDRREEAALLAECPALAPNWRERLRKLVQEELEL